MKQKNKSPEILDASRTSDIFKLMVKRKLARVRDLLNDQAALEHLRFSGDELAFLHAKRRLTATALQRRLWERETHNPPTEWEPLGGFRIAKKTWQFKLCEGCGKRERVYRQRPNDKHLCRTCRLLTTSGAKEVFCSNCKAPAQKRLRNGRCGACDEYLRKHNRERAFRPDGTVIRAKHIRGPVSSKTRAILSAAHRGIKPSAESLAKRSASMRARLALKLAETGHKHSPEAIAKWSAKLRGRKLSPEQCAQISAVQRGRKRSPQSIAKGAAKLRGRKRPPEVVAKMAAAHRGKKHSPEWTAKQAAKLRGRKQSPEAIAKRVAAMRGHQTSPETRAKIGAANRGRKPSAEHRAKMSAAARARKPPSPETRAKLSALARGRKPSPESNAKRAAAMRGRKRPSPSPETRAKLSAAQRSRRARESAKP